MTKKKTTERQRVAWDACVWIDFFCQFKDTYQHIKAIAEFAEQGHLLIVSSSIVLAEAYRIDDNNKPPRENLEDIRAYLMNKHVKIDAATRGVCELAQDIQALSVERDRKIKPMDAIHLATAAYTSTPVFMTLEGKPKDGSAEKQQKNLLRMDGLVHMLDNSGTVAITTPRQWALARGIVQTSLPTC